MTNDMQKNIPITHTDNDSSGIKDKGIASFQGELVTELPKDLYIPPEALEVFLEAFEGPLDLLLYLIKKNNIDIIDMPVALITYQYMEYIDIIHKENKFELAAEYLVMAATLVEIKSRILLPRQVQEDEEEDPRAELIKRLQEYERFKIAAEELDTLPRRNRDFYMINVPKPKTEKITHPDVDLSEVLNAALQAASRADLFEEHYVEKEQLSIRERMVNILSVLTSSKFIPFVSLFTVEEGRLGVVVSFVALMELTRESLIEIVQTEPFGPIHLKARE